MMMSKRGQEEWEAAEMNRDEVSAGISRRQALATLGAGALAVAAGAFLLPGGKAFAEGEPVVEPVNEEELEPLEAVVDHPVILTTIAGIRSGTTVTDVGKLYFVTDAGREGEFVYDPIDVVSADDDGIVFVSSTGARFKRIHAHHLNVRWFGAKGDNVTDDSAAFQTVINLAQSKGGGTVFVPAGKYVVTNLKVTEHNVIIRGEGFVSTYLVNRHLTNPILDVQRPVAPGAAQLSLTNFELSDVMVKNEVVRAPGDYPILLASTLVHSKFTNIFFQNSTPGGSYYRGTGVKIIDGFEIVFETCTWRQWARGYGIDMPNKYYNSGNISFLDCLFMYCGHGLLYARGPGAMSNSVLVSNCKFVGWQGGHYVSQNRVRYYQTTATGAVTDGNSIPVPDASKFTANENILVGSESRATPAVIVSLDLLGNRVVLDRPVTISSGDTVLQGSIAIHFGWRAQELKVNVGHFEGLDVGVHSANRFGLLTLDSVHAGNSSNIVVVDDQVKYMSLSNSRFFYRDVNQLYTNWWTVVRITRLQDNNNVILLDNNYLDPEDASDLMNRQIVNQTPYQPFVRIMDRIDGIQYYSGGHGTTYHDDVRQAYNRTATNKTTRQRWTEAGADKWLLDFKDTDGHLGYKLASKSQDSLQLNGSTGNVVIGADWNQPHLQLGSYHLWVDSSGNLRIKNGAPNSSNDGKRFNTNNGGGHG